MRWQSWIVLWLATWCCVAPGYAQRLHLADLKAVPKKIVVKWDQSPQSFGAPSQDPANSNTPAYIDVAIVWNKLHRTPGSTITPAPLPFSFSTATEFNDTGWQPNVTYEYWLSGYKARYTKTFDSQGQYWYWAGPAQIYWESPKIQVLVQAVPVTDAATADSRLDMRFATEKLLDYTFNAVPATTPPTPTLYRGGLFAGYQQDGSRVGRSYLRFAGIVPTPSSTLKLWPIGGLQVFVPRLARTGSVALTTRKLVDDTLSPSSLVWSNAPAMGSSLVRSEAISWNATTPTKQWASINVSPDIQEAINTDGTMALAVMSSNETATGWAYLARPGFTDSQYTLPPNSITPPNGLAPFLLFATLGPGADLASLTISPTTVTGTGGTASGTVSISAVAPTGGMEVSLASNNSAASVPNSVIIPAGSSSATFDVNWSSVSVATTATITGVMGNVKTATLTINPSGGGGGGTGALANLVINPGGVSVGGTAQGTITLSAPAPTGGTTVALLSTNPGAAQVPASVTVTAGTSTKTFTITTGPGLAYYQPAVIIATSGNSKTASLFVYPGGGVPGGGL
jgi:hypothetical protein